MKESTAMGRSRMLLRMATAWLLVKFLAEITLLSAGEQREYCQWENFNASCAPDEVILMQNARYGRIRFGRCMQEDHGSVGCSADVLPHLDRKCSGRRHCHLTIPDAALHNIHPCPKELMPYLEASYFCIKVHSPVANGLVSCGGGGHSVFSESGFLASLTSEESVVGTMSCPWVVQGHPGRRINLTLYSFSGGQDSAACGWGVVVHERNQSTLLPVCATGYRERRVYTSGGHSLRIFVQPLNGRTFKDHVAMGGFIIRYQVFGCADIAHIASAQIVRQKESMSVRCNSTGETFFLICVDSRWKGELNNCTRGRRLHDRRGFVVPYGILLTIGLGVASGVAFGVIILFGLLLWARRYGRRLKRRAKDRSIDQRLDADDLQGTYLLDFKDAAGPPEPPIPGGVVVPSTNPLLCPYHQLLDSNQEDEPLYCTETRHSQTRGGRRIAHPVSGQCVEVLPVGNGSGYLLPVESTGSAGQSHHVRTFLSPCGREMTLTGNRLLQRNPGKPEVVPAVGTGVDLIQDSNIFLADMRRSDATKEGQVTTSVTFATACDDVAESHAPLICIPES